MTITTEQQTLIAQIRDFPAQLTALVSNLSAAMLTGPGLPGEWTVAQNVHHIADSHMNSYIRCKLMATEDNPPLKPYDEKAWAQFPDGTTADLTATLALIRGLHARWTIFWESLPDESWKRTGYHPENGMVTLEQQLRLYVAHGEAHLAQIRQALAAQQV